MNETMRDVVVVGGGISGLTAAWHLRRAGLDVCLLESQAGPGGCMRTERRDGFLLEKGPFNLIVRDPAFEALLVDFSGEVNVVSAAKAARTRYIYRRRRLRAVPTNPISLITSGLLSAGGKVRLVAGLMASRRAGRSEETIEQAASRRFGREVADTMVSAVIAGIYAGDIRRLSVQGCFPTVARVDAQARSLIGFGLAKAFQAIRGKNNKPKRRWRGLISIDKGLGGLTEAMAGRLGSDIQYGCQVQAIRAITPAPDGAPQNGSPVPFRGGGQTEGIQSPTFGNGGGPGFELAYRDGDGVTRTLRCRRAVVASPCATTSRLLRPLVPDAADILDAIENTSLVVLNMGFRDSGIGHPLQGFGFLVPHNEPDFPLLGNLWADTIFPHHAPAGHRLVRVFFGGSHDPDAGTRSDDDLLASAVDSLRGLLDIREDPMLVDVCRYQGAIPQNHIGHYERISRLRSAVSRLPGLHLVGNYLEGVSVNDCVRVAADVAGRIIGSGAGLEAVEIDVERPATQHLPIGAGR